MSKVLKTVWQKIFLSLFPGIDIQKFRELLQIDDENLQPPFQNCPVHMGKHHGIAVSLMSDINGKNENNKNNSDDTRSKQDIRQPGGTGYLFGSGCRCRMQYGQTGQQQ